VFSLVRPLYGIGSLPSVKYSEIKLCGLTAVRARWRRDPDSIQRLFFDIETGRRVGLLCKALAASRRVYRCVEPRELERIAGSIHHGGIVAVAREEELRTPTQDDIRRWVSRKSPLLLLDRIGNPHNLGALARSAAFFGVSDLVIPSSPEAAVPNEAAYRVSEGGLEAVRVWRVDDLSSFALTLREAGYEVLGAAARGGESVRTRSRPRPASTHKPKAARALVLGNEEHGLSEAMSSACTKLVTLPGTGEVESLNVSVAGAVLIWELLVRGGSDGR